MSPSDKNQLLPKQSEKKIAILEFPTWYSTVVFFDSSKNPISLICTIFGYKDDKIVGDTILCFLLNLMLAIGVVPPKFGVCSFLGYEIHGKLKYFPSLELFRYPS